MAARVYTPNTLKRLYGKSGNCCAYPQCTNELIHEVGNISDICHIEALNPGGPRYNDSPLVEDKDRNNEPNLILLCRHHHTIIDQEDENGLPFYSTEQLKAMKKEHEELLASSRDLRFRNRLPSVLGNIVRELNTTRQGSIISKTALAFEIEEKIKFNEIERYYGIIQKFAAYTSILDQLYNALEASQMETVLSILNDIYLMSIRPNQSADDILDQVQAQLVERLCHDGGIAYSEELETCTRIVMVDAFMRCKILEAPAL